MLPAVIDRVSRATPRSVLLQIALSRPFAFSAGQAVLIGATGAGLKRPYSIAVGPHEAGRSGNLELLMGLGDDGSPGPHLPSLSVGTSVELDGPVGTFLYPDRLTEPAVLFVAGGWGIAALLEMLPMIANLGFIIAASLLFAWVLVIEQVPQLIVDHLTQFSSDKWVLLTIVVFAFLVIGCFVEATIVFLVVAPMLLPTLKAVGVSEVHFGIVTVVAMGIGLYTPPVGLALYMLRDMCQISFEEAVKAVTPFLVALVAALTIITYIPEIVLIVPRWLGLLR